LSNITAHELDLVENDLGITGADASWCRWVLCFVADPARVMARIAGALKPGGTAIFHEYADYRSWRMAPHCPELAWFVDHVIQSWRESGGEPDIALSLPTLLADHGMEITQQRLIT